MNRQTITILLASLVVASFAVAALWYQTNSSQQAASSAGPLSQQAEATGTPLEPDYAMTFGPDNAKVTIVEFLDPACEACRAFYPFVKKILAAKPDQIRLVVRYAAFHQGSDEVVRMLEAARLQDKFTPVLEALFEAHPQWASHQGANLANAWKAAKEAGLDVEKARNDMMSPDITARLVEEERAVKAFGVEKTPTFFVNGKPLPSFGGKQLVDLVASELGIKE